jgi:hypothetical protein
LFDTLILIYIFGRVFYTSLFDAAKYVATNSSVLLLMVVVFSFIGIFLGVRYYESGAGTYKGKIKISLIMNSIYLLVVFLLLLEGASII